MGDVPSTPEANHAPPAATRIRYLYRANGEKHRAEAVFAGTPTEELVGKLHDNLEDGRFVPEQVGLPHRYPWLCDITPAAETDPGWHELVSVEAVKLPPNESRTFESFVESVASASKRGWRPIDPFDHQSRHLPEVVEHLRTSLARHRRRMLEQGHERNLEFDEALTAPWDGSPWLSMRGRWRELAHGCARSGVWPEDVDWSNWNLDWNGFLGDLLSEKVGLAARFLVRAPDEVLRRLDLEAPERSAETPSTLLRHSVRAARCRLRAAATEKRSEALVGVLAWGRLPNSVVPRADGPTIGFVELSPDGLDFILDRYGKLRDGASANSEGEEDIVLGAHPGVRIRVAAAADLADEVREEVQAHGQVAAMTATGRGQIAVVAMGPSVVRQVGNAGRIRSTEVHTNGQVIGWCEPLFSDPAPTGRTDASDPPRPIVGPKVPWTTLIRLRMLTAGAERRSELFELLAARAPRTALGLLEEDDRWVEMGSATADLTATLSRGDLAPLLVTDEEEVRERTLRFLGRARHGSGDGADGGR